MRIHPSRVLILFIIPFLAIIACNDPKSVLVPQEMEQWGSKAEFVKAMNGILAD